MAVLGRRSWEPGKTKEEETTIRLAKKLVMSCVLPRDKLVGVLKKVIEERYSNVVELRCGWQVDPISFGNEEVQLQMNEEGDFNGSGPPAMLQISRCVPVSSTEGEGRECSIDSDNINAGAPTTISTNLLIGDDGAACTIDNAMETNDLHYCQSLTPLKKLFERTNQLPFRVKRYKDHDNP